MRKTFLFVFTAIAAVCLSFGIAAGGGASVVNAETAEGVTPTLSSTRYLRSIDGKYILLATGIKDFRDCYECGYELEGVEALTFDNAVFYTSISINGGEKVWTTEDLFPEGGYSGMIVWEVEHDLTSDLSFKAYVRVGERVDGELFESDVVVENALKELRTGVVTCTDEKSVYSSFEGGQTVENWNSSSKMLVFDYKWTTDNGSGNDYVQIQLLGSDDKVLTPTWHLQHSNDQLSTYLGRTVELNDGWRQFRVRLCDLPLSTGDGADGSETLTQLKIAKSHRYDLLVDNIKLEDITQADEEIALDGTFSVVSGDSVEIALPDYDKNIIKTLEMDLDLSDSSTERFDLALYDETTTHYYGVYAFRANGMNAGYAMDGLYASVGKQNTADYKHFHIVFNLSELNAGSDTKPGKLFKLKNTANNSEGVISNVKFSTAQPSLEIGSSTGWLYLGATSVESGKILSFDLSCPSNADIRYLLAETGDIYFGNYRFYAPYKGYDGVSHENAITAGGRNGTGVTYTEIGTNLYHLEYDLSSVAGGSEKVPTTIFGLYNNGTKADTDGYNVITNIKWLESTTYTVSVTGGSGSGTYRGGESVTVSTKAPYGKAFAAWEAGGEVVSTDNPYTFTVTEDIALTAVFVDGETQVMLSSGFDIELPDYDESEAVTLEFDVYVTSARSPYTKVYWRLYDADGNYFGHYRITYGGIQATDTAGYSYEQIGTDTFHVTLVLSELAGGSGTPGKIVRLADDGQSVNLDGAWIDNIEFLGEKAVYTVTVEGGTGGGEYQDGKNATVTATIPDDKNFVEWQIGGEKVSEDVEYTFKVTGNVTITAVFEDKEAGDTKVMLTSGYEIDLPDYDASNATTLEFDVYATSGSPYAKINIVLTDENGVSTKYYRVTYSGVNKAYNAEGVSCSSIDTNTWHIVLNLGSLTNGKGTSLGKLVTMSDSGSTNIGGCWIDNIVIS